MTEEQHIQKGFNDGYLLANEKPFLADKLCTGFVDKNAPYALGFIAGTKEYELENRKNRKRNYNVGNISKNMKNKTKEKGRDKGEREI